MTQAKILIVYHSKDGATQKMSEFIEAGAKEVPQTEVILKNITEIKASELVHYDGIAFGSPVYFGTMSAEMKSFLDQTLSFWKDQELSGIPATAFVSAGSGAGSEGAIINIWSVLASHGMTLVTLGKEFPFGVVGKTPLADEAANILKQQGRKLALTAIALKNKNSLELPQAPKAVGNYKPYQISGKHVYINQIALENGAVKNPGKIGDKVSMDEAKASTKQTALNVLAVLKDALKGDLSQVKSVVQLTGYFNTTTDFQDHALLMNEASNTMVDFLGERGKHARATMGVPSLPLNSPVEIQAIFEMK